MRTLDILKSSNKQLEKFGFSVLSHPDYNNVIRDPHSLDVILFSWFISGKGKHYIADNKFDINSGSMGITPIGITHDIQTDGDMTIINLFINPRTFPLPILTDKFMSYLQILLPFRQTFARLRENVIQINCSNPEIITELLKQILHEQERERYGNIEVCYELLKLLFMQLIREIVENGHISISKVQGRYSEKIMKVVSYLDSHYMDKYSLENLAHIFGFSKTALCANFKKGTGKTIFEYIVMKRIEKCSLLLCTTTKSITEIAYVTGFNDISFFNKKFKELTRMSPGGFRKI
ncbi:MAG: AraC family transcriptional regulator [Spirochaetaceae bacterium]